MRFNSKEIFAAAVSFALVSSVTANSQECLTSYDADTDYFPDKVTPGTSMLWDVEYHNTYKVATNKYANLTYVLYQCGVEPPAVEGYDGIFAVPLQEKVALASTPFVTSLELLGLRDEVGAYFGSSSWVDSPCFVFLMEQGVVQVVSQSNNITHLGAAGISDDNVAFFSSPPSSPLNNTVVISDWHENTMSGRMEWLKFFSLFFNAEVMATEVSDEANCRFDAVASNVGSVTSDMAKPTVLWAYYSGWCGGWDVAECPNYYCEMADACDATILSSTEGSIEGQCSSYSTHMTDEEFKEFGQGADKWIFPSGDWDVIYEANKDLLDQFVAVQNGDVYDYQGSGASAWFELRYAEMDIVQSDFCVVAGTMESLSATSRRLWFRNVFTEPVGEPGSCDDPLAALESRGNNFYSCVDLVASSDVSEDEGDMSEGTTEETPEGSTTESSGYMNQIVSLSLLSLSVASILLS